MCLWYIESFLHWIPFHLTVFSLFQRGFVNFHAPGRLEPVGLPVVDELHFLSAHEFFSRHRSDIIDSNEWVQHTMTLRSCSD
jgi:hypothetical protein